MYDYIKIKIGKYKSCSVRGRNTTDGTLRKCVQESNPEQSCNVSLPPQSNLFRFGYCKQSLLVMADRGDHDWSWSVMAEVIA